MKTITPAKRLARDLIAYRDVYVVRDKTMVEAARRAKCHRATLHRRIAALPAELTDAIDRLERLSL